MYVSDGFWLPLDAMHAPSVTKTLGTYHVWFQPFSIDVFGSRPIRAVPIS